MYKQECDLCNAEILWIKKILKDYDLFPDQYDFLERNQKNKCYICQTTIKGIKKNGEKLIHWQIDHYHNEDKDKQYVRVCFVLTVIICLGQQKITLII